MERLHHDDGFFPVVARCRTAHVADSLQAGR
jgi:hypothetical protein